IRRIPRQSGHSLVTRWRAVLETEQVLLHLPQCGARDRVDAYEAARHFERRELFAADALELSGVEIAGDVRDRDFAADLVRLSDDCCFADMFEQHLFDLAR